MSGTPAAAAAATGLRPYDAIPRGRGLPWFGAPRALLTHPGAYLLAASRRLGPVFRVRLFGMEIVVLIGPEAHRLIMVDARERFSHEDGYAVVRDILGRGLLFQDGAPHRRARRLMTPAFHQQGVARYFDTIHERVRAHAERWAREGRGPMYDRFRRLTFDIMSRLILGAESERDLERLSRLNDVLARGTVAFPRRTSRLFAYGRGVAAGAALRAHLRGVIRARRAAPGDDALGLLLAARDEDGAGLDEAEVLEQAVILMFAGHETTTSLLTSFVLALRDHPDWRRRLEEEQAAVVRAGPLAPEHLGQLGLLDCVLKEVERLFPPISLCQRGVRQEVAFGGYRIPPGSLVAYSPWASHRLAHVFREPDRFDPERYLPPRCEHRETPYALVGFGGGPRLCIGQAFARLEAEVAASVLLREYEVDLAPGNPGLRFVPSLHPRSGAPGTVRRRANCVATAHP